MFRTIKVLLILSMILVPSLAFGANHYICDTTTTPACNSGGDGNGNDWANALDDLPSTFIRGDTYYVADGTYGEHTFSTANSGSTWVYIKKATTSDHGTDTGWSSAYGDGAATFYRATGDVFYVTSDYWDFDGQVGGGAGSWETGFGFVLSSDDTTTANKMINLASGNNYITMQHIEFDCPGEDHEGLNQDGVYAAQPSATNLTVSYCFFHDVTRNFITWSSVSDSLIEYSVFTRRHTTNNSPHGQGIQFGPGAVSNITIRYSKHYDQYSTAFICPLDATHEYIYVYGNEFWMDNNSRYLVSNGVVANTSGDTANHWRFYNNTIWNVQGSSQAGIPQSNGTDNIAYNNIWIDTNTPLFNNFTHDYNGFYSSGSISETNIQNFVSDPTNDSANHDFSLSAATDAGATLSSPYTTDYNGETRGADGVWDRGALEYTGEVSTPAGTPSGFSGTCSGQ